MDIAQQTDRIERLREEMMVHREKHLLEFQRHRDECRAHAVSAIRERLEVFLALAQGPKPYPFKLDQMATDYVQAVLAAVNQK
jgi:hypothetical protein